MTLIAVFMHINSVTIAYYCHKQIRISLRMHKIWFVLWKSVSRNRSTYGSSDMGKACQV